MCSEGTGISFCVLTEGQAGAITHLVFSTVSVCFCVATEQVNVNRDKAAVSSGDGFVHTIFTYTRTHTHTQSEALISQLINCPLSVGESHCFAFDLPPSLQLV